MVTMPMRIDGSAVMFAALGSGGFLAGYDMQSASARLRGRQTRRRRGRNETPTPRSTPMNTQAWLDQGNLTEALAQARRDVAAQPTNAGLRFLLFEFLALQEDFAGAEAELRQIVAAEPNLREAMGLY